MLRGWRVGAVALALAVAMAAAAGAAPEVDDAEHTWVGQIVRHESHLDYEGQACPVDTGGVCAQVVVRYRLVPLNRAAARALEERAGRRAALRARRSDEGDREHQGTLFVREVSDPDAPPPCPPETTCTPSS